MAERYDEVVEMRNEMDVLEEKHREALAQVQHRGEVIQQLRGDIKEANAQVGDIGFGWFLSTVRLGLSLYFYRREVIQRFTR